MDLDGIDRSMQSDSGANFTADELVFPQPDIATFAEMGLMKVAMLMLFPTMLLSPAAGATALVVLFEAPHPVWIVGATLFLSILFTLKMIPQYRLQLYKCPLVFDKRSGRMFRRRRPDPVFGDYVPLKDIAALQICSRRVPRKFDVPEHTIYELNVVLARPSGVRIAAMVHAKCHAMFADAHKLADFLGVPLLEHIDGDLQGKSSAG